MKASKKISLSFFYIALLILAIYFSFYFASVIKINTLISTDYLYSSDLEALSDKNSISKIISTNVNMETGSKSLAKIDFKLFDFFKIKSKTIEVVNDRDVYLSGDVVAMQLKPDGVIVTKVHSINTAEGEFKAIDGNILVGDVITKINGEQIDEIADLQNITASGEPMILTVLRNGKVIELSALPKLEKHTDLYRLGLTVDDDLGGIGTLTFIDKNTNQFGALGHSISKNSSELKSGKLVKANIIGVEKGTLGRAGEIKAYESFGKQNNIGEINKCTNKGVFGVVNNLDYIKNYAVLKTGGRFSVKPGDAQIICDIDGSGAKAYNIKIVKANKQKGADVKGLVIKVTDKKLLSRTGGIVQGMSGSPIIQNGRLIGAVTHVFLNDSTKGYGIYVDSMMNEIDL